MNLCRYRSLALVLLPLMAACAAPPDPSVTVRHVQSTETFGNGARWHLFLFDPIRPRSLDERLSLARAEIERDPACRWVRASRDEIVARTDEQGERYAETTLAVPLVCAT